MRNLLLLLTFIIYKSSSAQINNFNIIKDINSQTENSNIKGIKKVGNQVVFLEVDFDSTGSNGNTNSVLKFWKTDGTNISNYKIPISSYYAELSNLYVYNDNLFFSVSNAGFESGIWLFNPTTNFYKNISGTTELIYSFMGFKDKLFYTSDYYDTGNNTYLGKELMYYNPTTNQSYVLKNINTDGDSYARNFTVVNDKMFFAANDASNQVASNTELWVTDGTTQGTNKVKEINPTGSSNPSYFNSIGNNLIFTAVNSTGEYLYTSDGTESGTIAFKNVNSFRPNSYSYIKNIFGFGEKAFIHLNSGSGDELWVTEGTNETTRFIGQCSSVGIFENGKIATIDGNILFRNGYNLYKTDGQTTQFLKTVSNISYGITFIVVKSDDGNLVFSFGNNVIKTNGTPNGTAAIINKFEYDSYTNPISLETINNKILGYALPINNKYGKEIYEISQDTVKIFYDLSTTTLSSEHSFITNFKGKSYFWAKPTKNSLNEVFEFDGIEKNMRSVSFEIYETINSYVANDFGLFIFYTSKIRKTDFNTKTNAEILQLPFYTYFDTNPPKTYLDDIYYSTYSYSTNTREIWSINCKTLVRKLIKSFNISSQLYEFVIYGDKLFFFVKEGSTLSIWKLNNSSDLPVLVKQIVFQSEPAIWKFFSGYKNSIAFIVKSMNVSELWITDGSEAGTNLSFNFLNYLDNIQPNDTFFNNEYFYFSSYSYSEGTSLKRISLDLRIIENVFSISDGNSIIKYYCNCNGKLNVVVQRNNYRMYLFEINENNKNVTEIGETGWMSPSSDRLICLSNRLIFTAAQINNSRKYLKIYESNVGINEFKSLERKLLPSQQSFSRGIYLLNDKELLVSVVDEYFDLEWFTFRLCENQNTATGVNQISKIVNSSDPLQSSEIINNKNRVYYLSPKSITLTPGFQVGLNSIFQTLIEERNCIQR